MGVRLSAVRAQVWLHLKSSRIARKAKSPRNLLLHPTLCLPVLITGGHNPTKTGAAVKGVEICSHQDLPVTPIELRLIPTP